MSHEKRKLNGIRSVLLIFLSGAHPFFLANEKFDFLARPELLVNATLRQVALGTRMVEVVLGFLSKLRVVK